MTACLGVILDKDSNT
jgi:WD40 repeat protein